MRKFMDTYGKYLAVVLLIGAGLVWWIYLKPDSAPNTSQAFFVDEDTGEEQVLTLDEFPPRMNKNGKPTLVEAVKYTCDGGKTVTVAYYRKYSDGAKRQLEDAFKKTHRMPGIDVTLGTYVRPPTKGAKWVLTGTPEAAAAIPRLSCASGEIEMVLPGR